MDLCCLPRSLPALLPARSHLRPTSPLFRPISAPTSFKSLTSHSSRPEFRATASEEPSTSVAETAEKYEAETAEKYEAETAEKYEAKGAPSEFVPAKEPSPEKSDAEDFISKLNLKQFDSDDTYSILIYGTGALVALWLSSAVVGALDSIPLVPKLFEVVGLAYTIWFSYRYLIFKKNREELFAKIDEIKGQIIGPDEN
ncbi:protein CURVATURE THYLAKOID 1D, chloroplastic-like [Iris pallida]|uniref:Protein CURVATURE THYLAKOID 1D, chloroplastic-like n=1 Tax=Iris pallida TaxID=29817 RepID=A0AAX6HSD2_IRIPA|nr:protein CURVATURE THYLAKOID 1D, chloroplastic-like [Iris pallida]